MNPVKIPENAIILNFYEINSDDNVFFNLVYFNVRN